MRPRVWGTALAVFFLSVSTVMAAEEEGTTPPQPPSTDSETTAPAESNAKELSASQAKNVELRDAYLEKAAAAAKADAEGLQSQEQGLEQLFDEIRRMKGMKPGEKVVLPPGIENLAWSQTGLRSPLAAIMATAARVQKEIRAEKAWVLRRDNLSMKGIQEAFSKHEKALAAGKTVTETEMKSDYEAALLAAESASDRPAVKWRPVDVVMVNRTDAPLLVRIWKIGETAGWDPRKAMAIRIHPWQAEEVRLNRGRYAVRGTLPTSPTPDQLVADVVLPVEKPVMWTFLKAVPQFEVRVQEVKGSH